MAEDTALMNEILNEKIEKLREMELGTKEHSLASKDVNDLYRTQLEDYKVGLEVTTRQAKADFDYERMKMENRLKQEELEVRQFEATVEDRKSWRDFIGKLAGIGTVIGLTLGTFWYEDRDNVMPRNKLKFTDKIKFW